MKSKLECEACDVEPLHRITVRHCLARVACVRRLDRLANPGTGDGDSDNSDILAGTNRNRLPGPVAGVAELPHGG
jgi:hypothetical protein